ncbi:MAG TPA: hypothetical protein VF172_10710 [Nitrososphaera sp.]
MASAGEGEKGFFPLFTIVSSNFENDLDIVRRIFSGFEKLTRVDQGFRLSDRAEMAAGWWFYDILVTQDFAAKIFQELIPKDVRDKKSATIKIIDHFQGQLRRYGSEAKIKMHGDIPFAGPWWAWLMR